ncbi:NADH:ubiquinone reductase (Na(+)-transporting) subunit D [Myxococcota bacterium]|nr:NADH:ubiquinone reductase (Na(+)-transporting) subunit D [Myxococcota bacterium]MBU1380406.1 NADH:ubiquinone reductase (Na(+)-transporting) subunit D [Myxococcota bacterium]MBU1498662.1 NADH:ubiquinone reductase (Na(+)-transporting) subunit D [Myxococcota bacterium]
MSRIKTILTNGIWYENPIFHQVLGVCSALAVTTQVKNAIVMSIAVICITALTNFTVSVLRKIIPFSVRLIIEMLIISTFVIVFDQLLKAYYFEMSRELGPYVGLIITNCIILGRSEAFALREGPGLSVIDGIASGLGYTLILVSIAAVRELFGAGKLLGYSIISNPDYHARGLASAGGAFIVMGILIWIMNAIRRVGGEK